MLSQSQSLFLLTNNLLIFINFMCIFLKYHVTAKFVIGCVFSIVKVYIYIYSDYMYFLDLYTNL